MKVSEELKRVNDGINEVNSLIDERNKKIQKLTEKVNALKDRIDEIEEVICYHQESINEYRFPKWTDVLFALKEDMERVSGMKYKTSEQTIGLNCSSFIELRDEGTGEKMTIVVMPGYTDSNEVYIRYKIGEVVERCHAGSIWAFNRMTDLTFPLPDTADEIFEIMKKVSTR